MQAEIGVFGGSGFYSFGADVEEVVLDTPFGCAQRTGDDRGDRRAPGGVHPPPRARPRVHARARPGARQPLGDAHARRAPGDRTVRGRFAVARHPSRRLRGARPTRRPHVGPGRHVLRRGPDAPRLVRRPVLRRRRAPRRRGGRTHRRADARRRDGGGRPGSALFDARRVALVPLARVGTSST